MFQLETVKLTHPAEYKKIYEEIVNGENYKKMVGNTELATKAESQKLYTDTSGKVDVGVLQDNAVIELQTDQQTDTGAKLNSLGEPTEKQVVVATEIEYETTTTVLIKNMVGTRLLPAVLNYPRIVIPLGRVQAIDQIF